MISLPVIVVLALLLALVAYLVIAYNRFQSQLVLIGESWHQVDVELQRRFELIPNLVATVKGYAAHERAVLEQVAVARSAAMRREHHGPEARGELESALGLATVGLVAVAEDYPELKADEHFRDLELQLRLTEDRIAAGRRFYNGNVRAYNQRVRQVPSNLIAGLFGFKQAAFFELSDSAARSAPEVEIGN